MWLKNWMYHCYSLTCLRLSSSSSDEEEEDAEVDEDESMLASGGVCRCSGSFSRAHCKQRFHNKKNTLTCHRTVNDNLNNSSVSWF